MKLLAPLSLAALSLTFPLAAQTPQFTDPANLRGERVKPHDGRELPIDQGARGLQQMLRRLNTRASLMLIVAHPDDEDGGMLTYYSRGLGARVAMLTLTRGEGGQNAMTGDFGDALGLLRTQELLSADRYLGVDQMFGTEVDFGFSKTKEEAFSKWTHERVLYDAVRAVRLYRPLVIAAVFIGGVTDGHGQHQVSGEIAQEVFKAAGDPKVFPELTAEGILPWQPLKVYARVPLGAVTGQGLFDYATGQYAPARFTNYVTGEVTTTTPSADVILHEGQTDPLLSDEAGTSRSFVQFGRLGLGLQKSQIGPGFRSAPSGAFDVAYHRYGSRLDAASQKQREESFFEGIDLSLTGLATAGSPPALLAALQEISAKIAQATSSFDSAHPAGIAPALGDALTQVHRLSLTLDNMHLSDAARKEALQHELSIKSVQLNQALALALGLHFDATVHGSEQIVGSMPVITTELRSQLPASFDVTREWLENAVGAMRESESSRERVPELSSDRTFTRTFRTATSYGAAMQSGERAGFTTVVSRPYFERTDMEASVYQLRVPSLRNAPASMPALTAWATVDYKGVPVTIGHVVHDGAQPLAFIPEASLSLSQHAQVLPLGIASFPIHVHVDATAAAGGQLTLKTGDSWNAHPGSQLLTPGDHEFQVFGKGNSVVATTVAAEAKSLGDVVSEGYHPIGYGGLPRTNFYTRATDHIVPVDLKLPRHRRIGYLPGTGDSVPEALASIGLQPTLLTVADLTAAKLARFDTVILGVRAYNAHPDLHGAPTQSLLGFALAGGNVVLQYQTAEFTDADAPYPLTLGRDAEKVVDETAPMQFADPAAPVLNTPNKLTAGDFSGWIEERGHGFLRSWADNYTAPTETHDPGSVSEGVAAQAPQRGGLVTVRLGKGHWTYCAFALYRQLPEAVPGSYRLFSNLLAFADQP